VAARRASLAFVGFAAARTAPHMQPPSTLLDDGTQDDRVRGEAQQQQRPQAPVVLYWLRSAGFGMRACIMALHVATTPQVAALRRRWVMRVGRIAPLK